MPLLLVRLCDFKSARGSKPIRPCSGTSHSLCREEFARRHLAGKTTEPAKLLARQTERAMPKDPCGRIGMARLRLDTRYGSHGSMLPCGRISRYVPVLMPSATQKSARRTSDGISKRWPSEQLPGR